VFFSSGEPTCTLQGVRTTDLRVMRLTFLNSAFVSLICNQLEATKNIDLCAFTITSFNRDAWRSTMGSFRQNQADLLLIQFVFVIMSITTPNQCGKMDPSTIFEKLDNIPPKTVQKQNFTVADRLFGMSPETIYRLGSFAVLNLSINLKGLELFENTCNLFFDTTEDTEEWLIRCVQEGLINVDRKKGSTQFLPSEDLGEYFRNESSEEDKTLFYQVIDRYCFDWFTYVSIILEIDLPVKDEDKRNFFIRPAGLLDNLIHLPQHQAYFIDVVNISYSWQESLFYLGKFDESADVSNFICFPLARNGDRAVAKSLLLRIISVTKGMANLASRINLATLLREEAKLDEAKSLYKGTILGLMREKAFGQLVMVHSEISAIERMKGKPFKAIFNLELVSILNGLLRNPKSQAIARSQLSSAYRHVKLLRLALRSSKLACVYFRTSEDYLNLGKSLITQGNIYYNLNAMEKSSQCFEEALSIASLISDSRMTCDSLAGKARLLMAQQSIEEAKILLDEVISLRQRTSDHNIGIEFQNLGHYYEIRKNYQMALTWYKKALSSFRQYMPAEAGPCEICIRRVETLLEDFKRKKNSLSGE